MGARLDVGREQEPRDSDFHATSGAERKLHRCQLRIVLPSQQDSLAKLAAKMRHI